MPWIHAINESAAPELNEGVMNPMSAEKIRTLGRRLRLTADQTVLDVGAGRCGPAVIFAREFGCRVTAIEPHAIFLDGARETIDAAGLTDRFTFIQAEAADVSLEPDTFDVSMCLGATWAWGGLGGTLDAMSAATRPGGHVVAGEPFYATPEGAEHEMHNLTLAQIVDAFESRGLSAVTLIRSSADDWDTYNSIKALSVSDWLEANPDDADAAEVRGWRARAVADLTAPRVMEWAIVAGRKGTVDRGVAVPVS